MVAPRRKNALRHDVAGVPLVVAAGVQASVVLRKRRRCNRDPQIDPPTRVTSEVDLIAVCRLTSRWMCLWCKFPELIPIPPLPLLDPGTAYRSFRRDWERVSSFIKRFRYPECGVDQMSASHEPCRHFECWRDASLMTAMSVDGGK